MMIQCIAIRPRTRILKEPQSHNGCFTCKRRKVRCDLQRPQCERCVKAGRVCDGYRTLPSGSNSSTLENESSLVQLPWQPVMDAAVTSGRYDHIRLAKLGCDIFHSDALRQHGLAKSIWCTIPVLGQTDHLVAASMATFGASVEAHSIPRAETMTAYARYYAIALRRIQDAIGSPHSSSLILTIGCLLLAAAEVIIGQEFPALYHLEGTMSVLRRRQRLAIQRGNLELDSTSELHFDVADDLDVAGAIIDLGVATYALGRQPRLPQLRFAPSLKATMMTSETALNEMQIVESLHSSCTFTSSHLNWRYVPKQLMPTEAFIKQNAVCIELFQRIQELEAVLSKNLDSPFRTHLLRAQCSACLVYAQNLFEPREVSYDRFLASFISIVDDASIVIDQLSPSSQRPFRFTLDLGVVQPLYFTAMKCRSLPTRLKAIRLLRQTGREGPFDGAKIAVVMRRATELEFGTLNFDDDQLNATSINLVPEHMRLHSVAHAIPETIDKMRTHVQAFFAKCVDLEDMMRATTAERYKDDRHWDNFDELIPLDVCGKVERT